MKITGASSNPLTIQYYMSFKPSDHIISITSETNGTYKELKALLTGRGVKRYRRTIVSGSKVVPEILSHYPSIVSGWVGTTDSSIPVMLPSAAGKYRLSRELFRSIDVNGTGLPLLVVDVPAFEPFDEQMIYERVVLFVPFQDPANVGAVIRSAAAFGVKTVVLLKESANPYLPKSIRAAGTPLFSMRFLEGPSINDLKGLQRPVIALAKGGTEIGTFEFPVSFYLLPGIEGYGIPESVCTDSIVSIPMAPDVESLNAVVATSIALYEWARSSGAQVPDEETSELG